ncbi:MAG: C45 family autoproteolytic acyltransferase/hydrolase [Gaiellales bacterium]
MTPAEIPVVRVEGDHRAVGRAVGEATAAAVQRAVAGLDAERVAAAEPYRAATARELPWLVEELDAVAAGAEAHPLAVFAASIEELEPAVMTAVGRCSDLVAGPPATADGHLRVAHNNDLSPQSERDLVAIEWRLPGDPTVFTIGIGPWISVGFNSAGLALTGNELTPNDNRVGIPRLLQVRDILRRRTLDDAVRAALHPRRASSYANLLSHRDDGVVCVEGSATDAELLRPSTGGTLSHTNHYVSPHMQRYEGDPAYARRSAVRYRRALQWLAGGQITSEHLRSALCDHRDAPDSLCRHGAETKTVFWCMADVTTGEIAYGRGNPCDSHEQRYVFA